MTPTAVFKKFPSNFWYANAMELFERWAFYGFYMLFALYLTGSTDQGGLGFSQTQKGMMMGIGTAILYFLPLITGAIADRIGYRKTLFIAYSLYTLAFLTMPMFHTYSMVFVLYLFLAIGAALFKPIISATVAKTTNSETSSIGFGIFYMMVNIGAFVGPFVTSFFKKYSWDYVFYSSAAVIAFNFILLIFLFKEPASDRGEHQRLKLSDELKRLISNILEALSDWRFFLFLLIIAGFWTMYYQLFYSLPVFIDQWSNTHAVFDFLNSYWPWLAGKLGTADGTIPAELMVNADAGFIILFQIIVSSIAMRYSPLKVMTTGILIASLAMGMCFSTQSGLLMLLFLLLFSFGEMSSSPKITEYIGRIAPPNKTALYMGCSFIPVAIGSFFAGFVSGNVYQAMSDKISFAQREAVARNFQIPSISEHFSQNDYIYALAQKMGMNNEQFTQFLWDKYHPSSIWMVITGIGIGAAILLYLYDRFVLNLTREMINQIKNIILSKLKSVRKLIGLLLLILLPVAAFSQEVSRAFVADDPVDSVPKGKLLIAVDNLNFFKDNEYKSEYVEGYTLPGMWIRPKLLYYPDNHLRLELGGQVLAYHGREEYHLYPWFSAMYMPLKGLSLRMGNLNQDLNHGLAEPIMDSEHFLKDKPEAGIQAKFENRWLKTDLWIDWQNMIFTGDPEREKFVFGTVAELTMLDKGDKKITFPVAFNGLHEGGEIDTSPYPAQTHIVVSEGIRYDYKTDGPLIKSGRLEVSFLQSTYPRGETGLSGNFGYAFFIQTAMNTDYGNFGTGYWQSNSFFTPLGMPLFQNGAIGNSETLKNNYLFVFSYRYNRKVFDNSQFGFTSDLFYNPSLNKLSTSAGLYLMINLSFLCGKSAK